MESSTTENSTLALATTQVTLVGGPGDDVLNGGPKNESLSGGAGNDTLLGGEGDDILSGDAGKDILVGGPGNDTYLFGRGDGQDRIKAMEDSSLDKLKFGLGISLADVDVSHDPVTGDLLLSLRGSSDSVLVSGYFNNPPQNRLSIHFADGAVLDGLAIDRKLNYSDDSIGAGPASTGQTVDGGLGHDTLFGAGGNDILYGDAGNDILVGASGNDTYIFGRGDGQDRIDAYGDSALDKLAFGSGISLADVDVSRDPMTGDLLLSLRGSSDSVRVSGYFNNLPQNRLSIQFADGAVLDGLAIDRKLNYSDDTVSAGPTGTGQTVDGGLGNDQVFGGVGDDILYGDAGNDLLVGGPGNDTYVFGRGDGQDRIEAHGDSALDKLAFGSGISLADVDVSRDPVTGDLLLSLRGSSDSVRVSGYFNNPPQNRLSIQFADGAVLDGVAIDRKLNYSDDAVSAGPTGTGQTADGGLGNDQVFGNLGDDILYGDAGNDILVGASGNDTYIFGRGDGQDRIEAYGDSALDKLAFGSGISLADVDVSREPMTGDLLLSLRGSNDAVRVSGYFNNPPENRLSISFADGAVLDGLAIERKLYLSDDFVGVMPNTQNTQTADGGLGNDQVFGNLGDDILYGDSGNDILIGASGNDTYIFGRGDGQDRIEAYGDSALDKLAFGSGISLADVDVSREPMTGDLLLSLRGSSDSVRVSGYFNNPPENRLSISFADGAVLDGWAIERKLYNSDDFVGVRPNTQTADGGLGNDQVFGSIGDDILYGDAGNDFLIGGPGNDTYIFGRGDGQDRIEAYGDSALDKLAFGSGISLADVDVSRDPVTGDLLLSLRGSNDSVRVSGYFNNPPENRLSISFADGAVLDGWAIDRKLYLSDDFVGVMPNTQNTQTADGGLGNDQVFGSIGDDILYGDAGNDTLIGGWGNDTYIFGRGDGQDRIDAYGDSALDKLAFGSGISLADVDVSREPMTGDLLLSLRGSSDSVRVSGYFNNPPENRLSISFADGAVLDGWAIDRKLYLSDDFASVMPNTQNTQTADGGLGNDQVFGSIGDDILYGDAGNDFLIGGPGNDTYYFGRGDGQDRIDALGPQSEDKLVFGSGIGMADVDVGIESGDLVLTLRGSTDSVRVMGYFNVPSQDRLPILFADGAAWDSVAIERKITSSDDHVGGTVADNTLDGGRGNDTLFGAEGDDILYGDAGNDFLIGGPGNDTYIFGRGDGQDRIDALGPQSEDKLVFGSGIGMADVDVGIESGDLVLTLRGSTDSVRVMGYFNVPSQDRLPILFADGAVWDSVAIERKITSSDDHVGGTVADNTLDGGRGNDTLFGAEGDDILYGDAGNDFLIGGPGNDTYIFGRGDGQDRIDALGPQSEDKLVFGSGIGMADVDVGIESGDLVLTLRGSTDSVRVMGYFNVPSQDRLPILFADGAVWDSVAIERKITSSDDRVGGTVADNTLDGGRGNDTLFGAEGDDILYGDAGNDFLIGGPGNDTYIFGRGDGQDRIDALGPQSEDKLVFGSGIGMADVDVGIESGDLVLTLRGSTDSVRVMGYFNMPSQDRLPILFADGAVWDSVAIERKITSSDDHVGGTVADNTLDGGRGNDTLFGAEGDDILYGDAGNDFLIGGPGNDTYIFGRGDGQDRIDALGPQSEDKLVFGSGIGMADVDVGIESGDLVLTLRGSTDSVRVMGYFNVPSQDRLPILFADGAAWDSVAIERKITSSDDHVGGTVADNTLDGGRGNDTLFGAEGDDILYGDAGNDFLIGGPGNDTYIFGRGDGQDRIDALGPQSEDKLVFGSGIGMADVDVGIESGDLVLTLRGSTDSVRVMGYFNVPSQDRLPILFADGAVWDSVAIERKITSSDDRVGGTVADNTLDGGRGNDTLFGAEGDDILYGDAGNDFLIGGPGNDTYIFGRGDGQDRIDALGPQSEDKLVFGSGIGMADVDVGIESGDLVLTLRGSTDSVRVMGYFNVPSQDRLPILFADGAAWDSVAIERKITSSDDHVGGTVADNTLDGGRGNDTLFGAEGDDILYGDAGNDTLIGGPGNDTYYFGRGDGQDSIDAAGSFAQDKLQFGAGIAVTDVDATRNGYDLLLTLSGSADSVRLVGYFADYWSGQPAVTLPIHFADGAVWDAAAIERKLNSSNDGVGPEPSGNWMLGQTMDGGLGDDVVHGGPGNDILYGDAGNDTLSGGQGNDTYYFGRGDGQDLLSQQGAAADLDTLRFAADVTTDQLWFAQFGNDLQISIIGTTDTATVENWYSGDDQHVDRFQTADGHVLLDSQVQQLVQAMASFAPPPMGQTTLGEAYQPLMPVIAASWAS